MVHGKIWPAHPKPCPDELLSSWIVRVAQENGIKLQTLSWMLFGNEQSPWNRDIDRTAPPWLLHAFSQHTGLTYWDLLHTTLVTYRTRLYPYRQDVGQLQWITPVRHYGMRYQAFGQQFCPACLANGAFPYFRKSWRVALFTYCPIHQVELHDECPECHAPVVHYRGDFGKEWEAAKRMHICPACAADLRLAELRQAYFPNKELHQLFDAMLWSLLGPANQAGRFNLGFFRVLHQMCRILESPQNRGKLATYLGHQLGVSLNIEYSKRWSFEQHRHEERHLRLLCTLWLMAELEERLGQAWRAKAVRYNLMSKDFGGPPKWYCTLVKKFSNWRRLGP